MTFEFQGRIEVQSFHPRPWILGQKLAADPGVRATLLSLANEVATEATTNLYALGTAPPQQALYPRYRGRRWSARPTSVANEIKVKDTTKVFPLKSSKVRPARETRVALVVANHPYSLPYERGGLGITSVAFMRSAAARVASLHSGVRYDRRKGRGRP